MRDAPTVVPRPYSPISRAAALEAPLGSLQRELVGAAAALSGLEVRELRTVDDGVRLLRTVASGGVGRPAPRAVSGLHAGGAAVDGAVRRSARA